MRSLLVVLGCLFLTELQAALNTPALSFPSNGSTIERFDAFLRVSTVKDATGYEYEYDTTSAFNSAHRRSAFSDATGRVYTATVLKGKTYYWRARAFNSTDTSSWSSSTWSFKVFNEYSLSFPKDQTTGSITTFSGPPVAAIVDVEYLFEFDTTDSFNSQLYSIQSSQDQRILDSSFFQFGQTTYWRATVVSELGDTLDWSPTWKYTTFDQPEKYIQSTNKADPLIEFQWPPMGGCEIELQIDTVRDFSSQFAHNRLLPVNSRKDTLRELLFDVTYYVQFRAVFDQQKSKWTVPDSFRIYGGFDFLSPRTGGPVSQTLIMPFVWDEKDGADFRFQLSTDSSFSSVLVDSTLSNNRLESPDTLKLNSKYWWRVRAFHSRDTSEWTTQDFTSYSGQLRVGPPYSNAKDQPVRLTIRLWTEDWADSYIMEIDTGKAFVSELSNEAIIITQFNKINGFWSEVEVDLLYGQDYVYRAYAIRGQDTSEPSFPVTFKTKGAPKPEFPSNGFIGIGTQTNGLITGIEGSDSVEWQLDTSMLFNSTALINGKSEHKPDDFQPQYVGMDWPGELLFEAKYYWRTRCISSKGVSDWSEIFAFTTTQKPWLVAPSNGAESLNKAVELKWGLQGSPEDYTYQYQVSTDDQFVGSPVVSLNQGADAKTTLNLDWDKTYYWRVRAFHGKDTSSWSDIWSFMTDKQATLSSPTLVSPANNAINIPTSGVNLDWSSVSNATSYDVQVSENQSFSPLVASGNTVSSAAGFTGLSANTTYFWRVRAKNSQLASSWSPVWRFTSEGTNSISPDRIVQAHVFPNPASKSIQVTLENLKRVVIYNMQGEVVINQPIEHGNTVNINTEKLPNGLYFIQVKGESYFEAIKVVIEH
jgi:hypothetical protein